MPLYDFKCDTCGKVVENFRYLSNLDEAEICPACSKEMRRLFPTNTHAVIDSEMDSKPRSQVVKEHNEKLKQKHAGYEGDSYSMRQKINQQTQQLFSKDEYGR